MVRHSERSRFSGGAKNLARSAPDNMTFRMVSFAKELFMTDATANCLFCRIIRGEIPAKKVHEDDHVLAFEDIQPQAPTHVLIIPKKHFAGLKEAQASDAEIIGRCHLAAAEIARQRKIEQGYRTVLNVGPGAGQSVFHLHVHLIGGRALAWPPG
jgi:histidine triad (HIT) family protein